MMNITFPKIIDNEALLHDRLLSAKSLSVYWLSEINHFEGDGYKNTDEKITQLMYLIEEACKNVTTFCGLSRKIYQCNMKNNQPKILVDLILTIKQFVGEHWRACKMSLFWIGLDLFPGNSLPFRFTETQELLGETKKVIINGIIKNAAKNLPALFDNFEKIFNSLEPEKLNSNIKEETFVYLKLAKFHLNEDKNRSINKLLTFFKTVEKAFSLCLLKNNAVSNYPIIDSFAETLATLKFPQIFEHIYELSLETILKNNFIKFNSIAINGNGIRDNMSPIFFRAILKTFSEFIYNKKFNISLTNLGLTDADFASIINASRYLNIDTFDLTGNQFTGKHPKTALSLIRCDRWIIDNYPLKKIEPQKE